MAHFCWLLDSGNKKGCDGKKINYLRNFKKIIKKQIKGGKYNKGYLNVKNGSGG